MRVAMTAVVSLLLSIFALAQNIPAAGAVISTAEAKMSAAMTNGDADTVMSFFVADPVLLVDGSPLIRGRENVGSFLRAAAARKMSLHADVLDVQQSGPIAYELARITFTARRPDGSTVDFPGKLVNVWRWNGERWLVAVHAPSTDGMPGDAELPPTPPGKK